MLKSVEGLVLPPSAVRKIEEFVANYSTTLTGDREIAVQAVSPSFNFSQDIATAKNNKLLEEFSNTGINNKIIQAIGDMFPQRFVLPSGYFLYPKEGGYMGWHTNSDAPYTRLYVVYAKEDNKSFFRYRDPITHEIVTCWDKKGINIYHFDTPADKLFWHCVYAGCDRFSFGFRII